MNSIEVSVSQEKTVAPQKDAVPMRLYVKEKEATAYTLQKEETDFQKIMKEAGKAQEKGRDILVSEKDNPNIVHAKSNLHNSVDVGRVIEPAKAQDGSFKKGPGEVVLANFFEKLPLDTKAFDSRQLAQAQEQAPEKTASGKVPLTEEHKAEIRSMGAIHGRWEGSSQQQQPADAVKAWVEKDVKAYNEITRPELKATALAYMGMSLRDSPEYKAEMGRTNPELMPSAFRELTALNQKNAERHPSIDTKTLEAGNRQPDAQVQPSTKAAPEPRKPSDTVEKETGVKPLVAAQPEVVKEQSKEAATDTPAVDAKGNRIILNKTDYALPERVVSTYHVQDGKFKEKGSDALRFEDHGKKLTTQVEDRQVIADMISVAAAKNWGTLELKGTENFKQIAWMEAQAQGIETKGYKPNERDLEQLENLKRERGMNVDRPAMAGAEKPAVNSVEVVTARERGEPDVATGRKEMAPAPGVTASKAAKEPTQAGDEQPIRTETGRLIEHGAAKFNHDPKEKDSYFVKLDTENGEKVVWGKDLQRVMSDTKVKPGETITLNQTDHIPVTVIGNKRDEKGEVIGRQAIDTQRNKWELKPADLGVTRSLDKPEQGRVDAATKVLGKAIAKYPAEQQAAILAKVGEAINKGTIQLPTPKVTVRSVEKQQAPSQSREVEQARTR